MAEQVAIVKPYRAIGNIQANAVLEEMHSDEMAITTHPVEQGSYIADHAFRLPNEVIVTYGWSLSDAAANGNTNYLQDVYQALVAQQSKRELLTLYTGKRVYKDMLIKSLSMANDHATENVMIIRIGLMQIITATTSTVQIVSKDKQKNPAQTAAPVGRGTVSLRTPQNVNAAALPSGS